jgi:aerobic-type carbon monoxide dehydrogenase small subunit (CoxS/CutS family)
MDRIGAALGLDPYEIRARNVVEPGDRLPTGQVLDATTSARLCLEEAERRTGFRRRWKELERARDAAKDGQPRRGIGLSLYFHGAGFTGNGERLMSSPVTARLLEDGRIEVLTAMTDMGQGCAAVFPQIAAAAGGLGTDDLAFAEPDTGEVPDSGPTVASRTTMIVGGLIARTVAELRDRVLAWRSSTEKGSLSVQDGWIAGKAGPVERFRDAARRYREEVGPAEVTIRYRPPEWQTFDESTYRGAAYPTYAWGADVVEVEVDPDTLAARAVHATAVCEVGRAIHQTLCAGQIEGGTLQALGWALMEEVKLQDGRYLNDRLATYIIPTVKDTPRIDVHLLERGYEGGPFGAKGVGELPMDGGAPATAQAIENATGIPVNEIPATPERLLRASVSPSPASLERGPGGEVSKGMSSNPGKGGMNTTFTVNGRAVEIDAHPMERLLDVLRERLSLTGTKEGCGEGECGACTVLLDGEPVLSCLVPLFQCEGRRVETVEGIAGRPAREFLERFVATGGVQCGACTPGIVVTATALLARNPSPSREEARLALAGNLCRCTGYEGILRALCPEPAK